MSTVGVEGLIYSSIQCETSQTFEIFEYFSSKIYLFN